MRPAKRLGWTVPLLTLLAFGWAGTAEAVVITQLNSFAEFLSTNTEGNDFEGPSKNTANITFDATAQFGTAASWAGSVTSSGVRGLVEHVSNEPLTATLAVDAFEVGMFFGNDDFNLPFDAILSVFDAGNTLLGTVSVPANRNDFADQFIGLHSDTAFRSVSVSYQRPNAQQLSIYVDDFTIGTNPVPEPASIALLATGLLGFAFRGRRRIR